MTEKFIELYNNKIPIKEIVKQTGIPKSTLWRKLKKLNLVRTQSQNRKNIGLSIQHKQNISKALKGKYIGKDNWNTQNLKENFDVMTDELAYIIGVMIGDGYFYKQGIGLESKDRDFIDYFSKCIIKQFDLIPRFYIGNHPNTIKDWRTGKEYIRNPTTIVRFGSILLNDFLTKISTIEIISQLNKEQKISFLRGLWDSEGSVTISGRMQVTNFTHNNYKICETFQELLLEITGIISKINTNRKQGNHQLYFYKKEYIRKFYEIIKPTIQRKREIFEKILDNS